MKYQPRAWARPHDVFRIAGSTWSRSLMSFNNVGSWALVMLLVLPALNHLKPCERDMY